MRNEWRQRRTAMLTQVLLSTISALLPYLGRVVQPWVTEGFAALSLELVFTLVSCLQLSRTVWAPGYIIVYPPPASAVLPLIYTGASLDWRFGRGSIYKNILPFEVSPSSGGKQSKVLGGTIKLSPLKRRHDSISVLWKPVFFFCCRRSLSWPVVYYSQER